MAAVFGYSQEKTHGNVWRLQKKFVTLLPTFNIGNDTAVQAQNFAYENGSNWLPWMEVTGKDKSGQVKCDACDGSLEDDRAFITI